MLDAYRHTGAGWQTRINADLAKASKATSRKRA
jgi:uncharacterized protein (DUF4415 family)